MILLNLLDSLPKNLTHKDQGKNKKINLKIFLY